MKKAVFLDRDGTLNELRLNPETGELEPPHHPSEFIMKAGVTDALKILSENGYLLFVVSNQPDFAKGKASLEDLIEVHDEFHKQLLMNAVHITKAYYCYHHPEGVAPGYSTVCPCRKPEPYFVNEAIEEYFIDRENSWFIGDRMSDVECGKNAGVSTVFLTSGQSNHGDTFGEDIKAENLDEAVSKILTFRKE